MGYEFWRAVMEAGYSFVIRAGANVRLLKKLGYAREYDQTIYLWPKGVAKKELPPLVLRVVWVHDGKTADVLGDQRAEQDASERSADRGHLQSALGRGAVLQNFQANFRATQAPQPCGKERPVGNRLVVAGAMECLSVGTARNWVQAGKEPRQLSPVAAIKAIQQVMHHYRVPPDCPDETLWAMLRCALQDDYQRNSSKTARNYPRKRKRERIGVPKVIVASKSQIAAAQELKIKRFDFQLTA